MTLSDSNQSNETDIDAMRNYIENHHSLSPQKTSSAYRILLGSIKIQQKASPVAPCMVQQRFRFEKKVRFYCKVRDTVVVLNAQKSISKN
ncbi:hypothetical protein NC653_041470 [Populus alba x Populus x berolinensis]|uniref:Uncharacterized protein n=1 Tax=Populus alba x Populus x berolinensis TaxID=444605 RepID=A0AAD6L8W8_9ROSI|nr:hypothetical protein NC653_041470 [Populus alba x Populus x berolinensis]